MARGLKRGNWSTPELERLRALYHRSGKEHVARLLRRSVASVERKAKEIFAGPTRARPWTAEDDLRLRESYGVLDLAEMCLVLSRPAVQIRDRIRRLAAIRRDGQSWSRTDLGLLKQLYGSRSDQDLVVCLGRSIEQIRAKAQELRLSKDKAYLFRLQSEQGRAGATRMPRWQADEVEFLRGNYARQSNLALARQLGRSVASVANKASQLGLSKDPGLLTELGRKNVQTRYHRG